MYPCRSVSMQIAASIAPLAPSEWPCIGFVPLTGMVRARSPKTCLIASVSVTSLSGVLLAWAFT